MADDQKYKVVITFEWKEINGERSGRATAEQDVVNRQEREGMQRALTEELLRWGMESLRLHGLEVLNPPAYMRPSGTPTTRK